MNEILFSSKKEDWETPKELFDKLNEKFKFTLDVASSEENKKCNKYYTKKEDGLLQNWDDEIVWCNPPYGKEIGKWVEKASKCRSLVVMLLPSRTDTRWFHDYIYQKTEIYFIKGRLKFVGAKSSAPFPSMIVIFNRNKGE